MSSSSISFRKNLFFQIARGRKRRHYPSNNASATKAGQPHSYQDTVEEQFHAISPASLKNLPRTLTSAWETTQPCDPTSEEDTLSIIRLESSSAYNSNTFDLLEHDSTSHDTLYYHVIFPKLHLKIPAKFLSRLARSSAILLTAADNQKVSYSPELEFHITSTSYQLRHLRHSTHLQTGLNTLRHRSTERIK
ncbi:hypothetical protein BD410DRAFT_843666 [Rickenella mellea]|uniref:Uncharacterized protein n=1 Tax=Rickenella mellea TaxID=50990 RepID=A0A4Y7PPM2_9AGAM|nr:hypothetical protein BD410DRAFT_843666 [Rickenella mellea]